jgi:adenosylcobinamide amidohydrolase
MSGIDGHPMLVDAGPTRGASGHCLVWRLAVPMRAISSSIVGGGIGPASWVINMTVDSDYARLDPAAHLDEVAARLGLVERGVGLMTAVDVASRTTATCEAAVVTATVGVRRPVWAADPDRLPKPGPAEPGTINLVAFVAERLSDAALVNVVATITEAKVQALLDHRIDGTGTASDAVCILCPTRGDPNPFGGPRSVWGGRLAQATYDAISTGIAKQCA